MKKLGLLFLSFVLIVVVIALVSSGGGGMPETCEALAPQIVDLSDDKPLKILKLRNIEAVKGTKYLLECNATAKMNNGRDSAITFHLERDEEGDHFIGYELR